MSLKFLASMFEQQELPFTPTDDYPGVMHTFSNKAVNPTIFWPEDVDIDDIAGALAKINRFNGHTNIPFSVAEHCIIGSYIAPLELKMEALLHDTAEAYIGDMILPVKYYFPAIEVLESRIAGTIIDTLLGKQKWVTLGFDDHAEVPTYTKSPGMQQLDTQLARAESMFLRPTHWRLGEWENDPWNSRVTEADREFYEHWLNARETIFRLSNSLSTPSWPVAAALFKSRFRNLQGGSF